MSEVAKAITWIDNLPLDSARQKANGERLKQLVMQMDRLIEMLRRRDTDLSTEVMELRALLNAYRALGEPNWHTEV